MSWQEGRRMEKDVGRRRRRLVVKRHIVIRSETSLNYRGKREKPARGRERAEQSHRQSTRETERVLLHPN